MSSPKKWKNGFELRQCNYYSEGKFKNTITSLILKNIEELKKTQSLKKGSSYKESITFISEFMMKAATMKLMCFKEENEWRAISQDAKLTSDDNFNFRSGKSGIIPYYAISIDLKSIVEIVIGPCGNPYLARRAVGGLWGKYDLSTDIVENAIRNSKIPYREY